VLNLDNIVHSVTCLAENKKIWVAYSGGVDSHVLLHLLATRLSEHCQAIHAIHIDHGLQSQSKQWTQHCADIAAELNVDFIAVEVVVNNIDSLGMEAAAREARYQALEQYLTENDILLTAQHQDDQAETLLLQLFRGAGPKGLSAMADEFQLGDVKVLRPLIAESQHDILAYAQQHQLSWIDDPSNSETRWNRNYVRHTLWPTIVKRWPSAAKTLSRSAQHCAEASELLDDLAQQDLVDLDCSQSSDCLPIRGLLTLTAARRNNLLRFYLNLKQLPMPSTVNLQRVYDEVCLAKQDSVPLVSWAGVEVRRYQDQVYFMRPLVTGDVREFEVNNADIIQLDPNRVLAWQTELGKGIKLSILSKGISVRFRQGGERIKLHGSDHHKSVKHLFQEWMIPPWQRDQIPLLFSGDELIAIAGYCVSESASVRHDKQGYFPVIKFGD
jgi:tRNA(Ile)-lysidine synthase